VSPESLHSLFLLAFMLVAAKLASYIPLAALAAVLVVVSWNMAEKGEFIRLLRDWRTASVLAATFGLTLARDLTTGIIAGCLLAALIYYSVAAHPRRDEGNGGGVPATPTIFRYFARDQNNFQHETVI